MKGIIAGIIFCMLSITGYCNTQNMNHAKNDRYIFVLFFSDQCPYCIQFAPVIKRFSASYEISVEAVSLNGKALPEFPDTIFATQDMIDLAYEGKPVTYPALFIADRKARKLFPVSFGALSFNELEERMQHLMPKIISHGGASI